MKSSDETLRAQIQALQDQVSKLTKLVQREAAPPGPRAPMWTIVREYLRSCGGSSEPQEIVDALERAGHDLGRYPLRNVKITLTSPVVRHLFSITQDATGVEKVRLVDQPLHYTPPLKKRKKLPIRKKAR